MPAWTSGSHRIFCWSALSSGSARKRQPPALGEGCALSLGPYAEGVLLVGLAEVGSIVGIAPQELEGEIPRTEGRKILVGGRHPPIAVRHGDPLSSIALAENKQPLGQIGGI